MKIVLATGIYPPQIGGPATYCRQLAQELSEQHEVIVVTYGGKRMESGKWKVENVSRSLPLLRWLLYALTLRKVGKDADVVYCFSSISCGVPLVLSMLKKPKRVLRLGGDFFWERYTDWGGRKSLRDWYQSVHCSLFIVHWFMSWLLNRFDYIVFSTRFQEEIYEKAYRKLPEHSVIENALNVRDNEIMGLRDNEIHKLLFMGRFVRFKNLRNLVKAMEKFPEYTLTLVGDGPEKSVLQNMAGSNVSFLPPQHGDRKQKVFAQHDLLIIPSITDISPNVALEAKAAGLPVLLTQENGLGDLAEGMQIAKLKDPKNIVQSIQQLDTHQNKSSTIQSRPWSEVASETLQLFSLATNP